MDESGLGEDFTEDEKIGAFIVLACIVFAIGSVAWLIWGQR